MVGVVVFAALFAGYAVWLGPVFLDFDARLLNVHQNVPILLLALATLATLIAGMFDLSIASMATFTAFLTIGLRTEQGLPFWLVLCIALTVGLAGGLINGVLVEYVGVNTFIATLGVGGVLLGASSVYSDGGPILPAPSGPTVPAWFGALGAYTTGVPTPVSVLGAVLITALVVSGLRRVPHSSSLDRVWLPLRVGAVLVAWTVVAALTPIRPTTWLSGVSWLVVLLLIIAALLWLLIEHTAFGRRLRATGENPVAARLAGIRTSRQVIAAFMIGGFIAAVAGILLAANTGSVSPGMANPFLLPAFSAAFLSTVIFSTGRFTVWGSVIGGVFIVWVSQGLILGGLPATWKDVVNGGVLVVAVAISSLVRRHRRV